MLGTRTTCEIQASRHSREGKGSQDTLFRWQWALVITPDMRVAASCASAPDALGSSLSLPAMGQPVCT